VGGGGYLCHMSCIPYDVLFWLAFFCFGSIETPKLAVSAKKRNNRNKCFVSDSAETSFGPSFGCFEAKLVSLDTLTRTIIVIWMNKENYKMYMVRSSCTACRILFTKGDPKM